MTAIEPHLMKGFYNWFVENQQTPHILVDPRVCSGLPDRFKGQQFLTLNINPRAAEDIVIQTNGITFTTRFGGTPHRVHCPIGSIYNFYSKETGMTLMLREIDPEFSEKETAEPDIAITRRKNFKLI